MCNFLRVSILMTQSICKSHPKHTRCVFLFRPYLEWFLWVLCRIWSVLDGIGVLHTDETDPQFLKFRYWWQYRETRWFKSRVQAWHCFSKWPQNPKPAGIWFRAILFYFSYPYSLIIKCCKISWLILWLIVHFLSFILGGSCGCSCSPKPWSKPVSQVFLLLVPLKLCKIVSRLPNKASSDPSSLILQDKFTNLLWSAQHKIRDSGFCWRFFFPKLPVKMNWQHPK